MAHVLSLALPFFGLILIGFLAAKIKSFTRVGLEGMNFFIVYIALPALFFNLLHKTPVEDFSNWRFILSALFGTFCTFVIAFCVGLYASKGDVPESTIQGFAGAYGNIGYMGPGLALAAFGPAATVPVALIFCADNTLHFAMAPFMMALSDGQKQSPWKIALSVLHRIFTHPFIIATLVGIGAAFLQFKPPQVMQTLLDYLMNAAAPCALFVMGVTIAIAPSNNMPKVLAVLVPIKLFLHPVLVYVFVSWAGDFPPAWVYAAVLLAALPCATNVFVIAQQYNVWVARASSMVLITTVLSVISVTGLLYFITTGLLPPDLFPQG